MCRFPGLFTIGGLLIVIGAALLGSAPANSDTPAKAPEPVRITLRADRTLDRFLPQSLFAESPRSMARTQEKKESLAPPRPAKHAHFEVAMTGDIEEIGPPFRR